MLIAPSVALATTYYVDCQAGNDANSGTTSTAPKLDLYAGTGGSGAAQVASPGDTILIRRGTVCNFTQTQTINKSLHITSSASYYENSPSDPLPILSYYALWNSGWINMGNNVWKHTLPWTNTTYATYVRFSALGINNAGPSQAATTTLTANKDYFYYGGTSALDPAYVEVYAPSNPATYYGNVYYSTSTIMEFVNNGSVVSSGMQVDSLTFENTNIGIALYPLDANFASGTIQNIQCIDVHRCILASGNGVSGDTLANFNVQNNTITGASGPAIQFSGIDRMVNDKIRNNTITTTGVSESYGGIYTISVNDNIAAGDTTYNDFQISDNTLSDCRTGNLYPADGACVENDNKSLSLLVTRNTMSNSYECYHSNSGGVSGYTPPSNRGIYVVDNICNGTDKLGSTSDSTNSGKGLVYVLNNTLINGTVNSYAAQVPNRSALFNVENTSAVGIYVQNNVLALSPSYVGTAYGISAVSNMVDGSNIFESNNAYSPNLTANYVSAGGSPRNATSPHFTNASLVDSGTSTPFTTDFYGNPIYGTVDIGAIEYQPPYTMGTNLVDTSGSVRVYRNGAYWYSSATTTGGILANINVSPVGGFATTDTNEFLNFVFQQWQNSGNFIEKWTESGSASGIEEATTTVQTIGGFQPNSWHAISVDGSHYGQALQANNSGVLAFAYSGGYSTHSFEIDPLTFTTPTSQTLQLVGGLKFPGGAVWR